MRAFVISTWRIGVGLQVVSTKPVDCGGALYPCLSFVLFVLFKYLFCKKKIELFFAHECDVLTCSKHHGAKLLVPKVRGLI